MGRLSRVILSLLTVSFFQPANSQELPVSALRAPNQNWTQALEKLNPHLPILKSDIEKTNTVFLSLETNTQVSNRSISALPTWSGALEDLQIFHQQTWAVRPYNNPNPGNFNRRAPWLFPADGCYAKAAHISSEAAKRGFRKPGKVYAFGNLSFRTPYAINGRVAYWSYHVAAAYQIQGQVFVLDPTIHSQMVLTLDEWVRQIARKPESIRLRFCDANSYSPSSPCRGGKGNGAYLGHIRSILRSEWRNLISLGYSPSTLLAP